MIILNPFRRSGKPGESIPYGMGVGEGAGEVVPVVRRRDLGVDAPGVVEVPLRVPIIRFPPCIPLIMCSCIILCWVTSSLTTAAIASIFASPVAEFILETSSSNRRFDSSICVIMPPRAAMPWEP